MATALPTLLKTPLSPALPDIQTGITITNHEALTGTIRTLSTPDGQSITINIPAGTAHGQILSIARQTSLSSSNQILLVHVSVERPIHGTELARPFSPFNSTEIATPRIAPSYYPQTPMPAALPAYQVIQLGQDTDEAEPPQPARLVAPRAVG